MIGSKEMVEEDYERESDKDAIYIIESDQMTTDEFWRWYKQQEGEIRTEIESVINDYKLPF